MYNIDTLATTTGTILAKQRFEICKTCENTTDDGFGCKLYKKCCFGKYRAKPESKCPKDKW